MNVMHFKPMYLWLSHTCAKMVSRVGKRPCSNSQNDIICRVQALGCHFRFSRSCGGKIQLQKATLASRVGCVIHMHVWEAGLFPSVHTNEHAYVLFALKHHNMHAC